MSNVYISFHNELKCQKPTEGAQKLGSECPNAFQIEGLGLSMYHQPLKPADYKKDSGTKQGQPDLSGIHINFAGEVPEFAAFFQKACEGFIFDKVTVVVTNQQDKVEQTYEMEAVFLDSCQLDAGDGSIKPMIEIMPSALSMKIGDQVVEKIQYVEKIDDIKALKPKGGK